MEQILDPGLLAKIGPYLDKAQFVLMVTSAVVVGLALVMRAVEGVLIAIPGDQGEARLAKYREKAEAVATFVAGLIVKLFPKSKV